MAIVTPLAPTQATPENRQSDTIVDPASGAAEPKVPSEDPGAKLAELARKEKAFVHKMKEQAAKIAALEAKEPELRTSLESAFKDSTKARLQKDLFGFLAEYGFDQDSVAQQLLNPRAPLPPEVEALQAKLEALEKKQADALKAQDEQRSQAFQAAVKQVAEQVTNLVDNDERFETIKAMGSHEAVTELIVQTYEKTGKLMSTEDAAQKVEDYLLNESVRVAGLKKVQAKIAPPAPTPDQPGSTTQPKTLTNRVETTPAKRPLTDRQRLENAIAVGKGEPKPH